MSEWKEYTGSDEQIAEMRASSMGFILRGMCSDTIFWKDEDFACIDAFNVTHFLICNPHPEASKIKQQADTGQPVWVRVESDFKRYGYRYTEYLPTTTPDWNIPGAEYSFTPFNEVK